MIVSEEDIRSMCDATNGQYVFYYRQGNGKALTVTNQEQGHRFLTASVIKVPLLFAWTVLESEGVVSSDELCDLREEPIVRGAGFSYLLRQKKIPYADVLLMMIAVSDNTCTNAVISRLGFERINAVFKESLGLQDTHLGRKMMTKPDFSSGRDNWTTAQDMIRCFDLYRDIAHEEKGFVSEKLLACEANDLFLRYIREGTVRFYHKTGGLRNVLNEWGFTDDRDMFLLMNNFEDEKKVRETFGKLGQTFLR